MSKNDFKKKMCHNIANLNHPDTITKILCKLEKVEKQHECKDIHIPAITAQSNLKNCGLGGL